MDTCTKTYLSENAQSLYRSYLAGEAPGADDKKSLHTAYNILKTLEIKPSSAKAIATYLNLSAHTIFEYLGVLEKAGLPIVREKQPNNKPSGRPITIFELNVNSKRHSE